MDCIFWLNRMVAAFVVRTTVFMKNRKQWLFGRWPEVLLGNARERLMEARRHLADGIDPMEQAKLDRIAESVAARNGLKRENWKA